MEANTTSSAFIPGTMPTFTADIPLDLARAAHAGTSHVPEQRAEQERASYAATLTRDHAALSKLATTDDKRAMLDAEFARYRDGYRTRYLAMLAAKSRCVSTMIAGPSGFPSARQAKRGDTADARTEELLAYRSRALDAIRKALCQELRPIMTGDSDAVERLRAELQAAEGKQARMTAANKAIRRHAKAGPDAQVAALVALGIPEGAARSLLQPDFCGRVGFADFETRNNGANIRRIRARIEEVSAAKATPDEAVDGERARLEVCPADNRVRLFYAGKPDADTRARLKASGFRWAPSIGAWQAYANPRVVEIARREAGIPSC